MLEHIAADNPDVRLSFADLHVISREFTGVGSFTHFLVRGETKTTRRVLNTSAWVSMPDLQYGLGVVAFYDGNSLTLETFTCGDEKWDGTSEGFTIETPA